MSCISGNLLRRLPHFGFFKRAVIMAIKPVWCLHQFYTYCPLREISFTDCYDNSFTETFNVMFLYSNDLVGHFQLVGLRSKTNKRNVQGVPQSQTAANARHKEKEKKKDKNKHVQKKKKKKKKKKMHEKHIDQLPLPTPPPPPPPPPNWEITMLIGMSQKFI